MEMRPGQHGHAQGLRRHQNPYAQVLLLAKGESDRGRIGDPRLTAATSDAIAQTANGEILEIANQEAGPNLVPNGMR